MLFKNVSIAGLAHIDAPHRLSSADINAQLQPTMDRLGIKTDVLQDIAGIFARRLWDDEVQASDAATLAAEKALADAGIDRARVGLLVNTSVSRDYLEPSTASIVSGNLGLGENCQNFDVANACLAFINGMDIASRMIERGEIEYALVVDGETANLAYKKTLERLSGPDVTEEQFRNELATLTLGCGAAAMVLSRSELTPDAPKYKGGTRRVRHPPGLAGAHPGLHQGLRHRPEEGAHHLRRARQHRPGLGADRAEQAQGNGPPQEGRPRGPAGHRLGPELLDGRGGVVDRFAPSPACGRGQG